MHCTCCILYRKYTVSQSHKYSLVIKCPPFALPRADKMTKISFDFFLSFFCSNSPPKGESAESTPHAKVPGSKSVFYFPTPSMPTSGGVDTDHPICQSKSSPELLLTTNNNSIKCQFTFDEVSVKDFSVTGFSSLSCDPLDVATSAPPGLEHRRTLPVFQKPGQVKDTDSGLRGGSHLNLAGF